MKTENDFLEALLKQGPQLSPEQYSAYRRRLHERLARAEREELGMRRIVFVLVGLAAVLFLGIGVLQPSQGAALTVLMVANILVPLVAGCAVLLYFFKYRPRLRDAQRQEQHALLLDLQRQLNELREQLSQRKT